MQPHYVKQTGTGSTAWQSVNWHISPINIGIGVIVSGTVNYTVQYTYEDPSGTYPNPSGASPTAFNHPSLQSLAANADGAITSPVTAIRITVNSGTGSATMVYNQAGIQGG